MNTNGKKRMSDDFDTLENHLRDVFKQLESLDTTPPPIGMKEKIFATLSSMNIS